MKATRSSFLLLATVAAVSATWVYWHPTEADSQSESKPVASASSGVSPERPAVTRPEVAPPHGDGTGTTLDQRADVARISARFEQSRRCYFAQAEADTMKSVIRSCKDLARLPYAQAQFASCSADLDKNESTLQELKHDLDGCTGDESTARHYYEATKAAALRGNADAQACYVQSIFQSNGTGLAYSPQDVDDYRRDTPRYISDGLARGDWRIVSLLARGGHDDGLSLLPLVTKDDAYIQYVMNRLLQLGAEGTYAQYLGRSIQMDFLSPGITTPPPLTQQQVATGIAEAQSLYRKSFDRKPLLDRAPIACPGG
ncbi:hypothetical protein [Rhodanobacter sp. OK091]|uniref:hypothetical protein n=1 Tax=Rhodanobacter sp. OK091 TaxID=1881037 RepID=UPI0011602787|nr:hypothetical protein [Rhodanobacter sp. OK091]